MAELAEPRYKVTIIRKPRRKTATIRVFPDDTVTLVVPEHLSDDRIREIVKSKTRWIAKRIRLNADARERIKPRLYVSGEEFPYLGVSYGLEIQDGCPDGVVLKEGSFWVAAPLHLNIEERTRCIRGQMLAWYKGRALMDIQERVRRYQGALGVQPKLIRIRGLRSRWGSCSSRGNLSFTWEIITAPLTIVDYVVVHELCHLRQLNHCSAFWDLVHGILPDYQERRRWLKAHGESLFQMMENRAP